MKVLLFVVPLLLSGVVGQYRPSGWRPDGPAFELPERPSSQDPRNQRPIKQEYLPAKVAESYGAPGVDLSVQGLPTGEQQPIFQLSPVNGLQYTGPQFNNDLKNLDQAFKQSQFQNQQEIYRQFTLQKQLEAFQLNGANNNIQSTQQVPRQLIPRTTPKPTQSSKNTSEGSTVESTTVTDLNEGEVENNSLKPTVKTSVQVEKQNLQSYPAELFLSPIAQSGLKSTGQFGQIQGPIIIGPIQEPNQKQISAYDAQAHFAALPSVLAQQQLLQSQAQFSQGQQLLLAQPQYQAQPLLLQGQSQPIITQPQFIQNQQAFENPSYAVPQQYQPLYQPAGTQYQPSQIQAFPQVQAQPDNLQSQVNRLQPNPVQGQADDDDNQGEPQLVYQPQLGAYQPRPEVGQPAFLQPQYQLEDQQYQPQGQLQYQPQGQLQYQPQGQLQYQPQGQLQYQPQGQLQYQLQAPANIPEQFYQQQFYQNQFGQTSTQQVYQGQEGSLQSGFDVNQQGNGIGNTRKEDQDDNEQGDDDNDGSTVTAVATAFGTRTQPRMFSKYGAPIEPDVAGKTTDTTQEDSTESGAGAAAAAPTAVSRGSRRKSAKLR